MNERINKYFQGELTSSERLDLLQAAAQNEELKKQLIAYQNIFTLTGLAPEGINIEVGKSSLKTFLNDQKRMLRRRLFIKVASYAAMVALLIATVWTVAVNYTQPSERFVANQQEFFVPAGQRARIKLPDGSSVWLNAGSTLTYPSVFAKERRVTLIGEGFFEVIKNPELPFIVSTGVVNIKALGTQFNVFCYPGTEAINTSLIEGSVKVYKPEEEASGIILKPNQQLFYEEGVFRTRPLESLDDLLWKEGIYNFKSERLEMILKKLELYYDTRIIVKSPEILSYKYTGKFRQRDGVVEILRIIQKIHHFKINKNDELNQITLSK